MSIRTRLTWAYGIGVALTLALVGALVWWQMSESLVQAVQTSLRTQAEAVLAALENQGQAGLQEADNATPGIWVVMLDSKGQVIDATAAAPAHVPAAAGVFEAAGRTFLVRVDRAGDGTTVVTGADLSPVAAAQGTLARILLGVGLSVGVASLVVGWILAGRALRPIDRLIADADALGPAELERRLTQPRQLDEVGRLTATLNRMLDRISESVSRQQLFVALASHELRTPLAALRAELDLADRDGADITEYRAALRAAQGDAIRLTSLTSSLLELATVGDEAHPLVRAPVSARSLATHALRAVAPLIEQNGATLTTNVTTQVVWVDRRRVEQALINMLANAIVHSSGPAQIELRGDLSLQTNARLLRLTVLDRGPGFGANDPAAMFTPFQRGVGVRAVGSGLGLAMVAATARAHGGSYGAHDRAGGGAAVWLAIPSIAADEQLTDPGALARADSAHPNRAPGG